MKIEEVWRQLEEEGSPGSGWSTRFARPEPGCRLLAAVDHSTGSRALLLATALGSVPPRREWPECRGLEVLMVSVPPETYLAVRLRDPGSSDVFAALAEVIAARIASAATETEAVSELFEGLRRWQVFLASAREGLSLEAQRGLFGELKFLADVLVPAFGAGVAVPAWKGSSKAQQDFQFPRGAIEIKTTAAVVADTVRVTSERQLDDQGAGEIFLHVVVVDDRDVPPVDGTAGESLAGLVARLRDALSSNLLMRALLDDGLLAAGWLDAQAARYDLRRLTVRAQRSFHVREGFPRLSRRTLPPGVGGVSYDVDLTVCRPFEVPIAKILNTVGGLPTT